MQKLYKQMWNIFFHYYSHYYNHYYHVTTEACFISNEANLKGERGGGGEKEVMKVMKSVGQSASHFNSTFLA